jgi:hypothetical protein
MSLVLAIGNQRASEQAVTYKILAIPQSLSWCKSRNFPTTTTTDGEMSQEYLRCRATCAQMPKTNAAAVAAARQQPR